MIVDSWASASFKSSSVEPVKVTLADGFSFSERLPANEPLNALRTSRQFILKSLVAEGFKEKLLLSASHDEIEQLALIIKMIQDDLGWAWLPKVLTESQYITDNLQALDVDQLKNGIKFSFALWNPHSKQVIDVKSSIMSAVEDYIAHFQMIQS
ncbi:hypothetical protein BCV02_14515 [Vibrio breoganii]|uniref:LysR substrate-binding domain-containing protein n=2 Tax=Vibrio breoganii TaxID=553239 RepID=A0ABX1UER3_9VIBR|nr:hypothetical protein [Vibrio breoganii]NMR71587.1 hypothetical protein [Vibrio breoganii]PMG01419.1 hypothetical protein BCV02_14515 [Vibrio breoganii]PML90167.1 hypothetical protein BCT67_00395 [Vibrio breoganii]